MKNIVSALVLLISLPAMAQEKFTAYYSSFANDTFDIKLNSPKPGKFDLHIFGQSLDETVKEGGLILRNNTYQGFIDNLNSAKAKYVEWSATAKQNNIRDLKKPIKLKPKRVEGMFLSGATWHADPSVTPTFTFQVIEKEGKINYVLLVDSGQMTASGKAKANAFQLSFANADEIDSFITAIKWEKIMAQINKPKSEDLFK